MTSDLTDWAEMTVVWRTEKTSFTFWWTGKYKSDSEVSQQKTLLFEYIYKFFAISVLAVTGEQASFKATRC